MKKIKTGLLVFFLLVATSYGDCKEDQKIKHDFVDKNVMGITIGANFLQKLESLYGNGIKNDSDRCYFNSSESAYVIFVLCEDNRICSVLFSKDRSLWKDCEMARIRMPLKTEKGIGLGDPPERIIKIYGSPQKKELDTGNMIETLEYHTTFEKDPNVELYYDSKFDFKNGKLTKLYIHDGP